MPVCAIIHTVGVVLGKKYIPLEFSFADITGQEMHFQLKSPISFHTAKMLFPHARPDAVMTTCNGYTFEEVVTILWNRYRELETMFSPVIVGCKGNSYQMQVLHETQLPYVINVETFGVPSLKNLKRFVGDCQWHVTPYKCSRFTVRVLAWYMFHQNFILPLSQKKLLS